MAKRKVIQIAEVRCNGCGRCALACAEGAIEIRGGKAHVVSDILCDGLGTCISECPEGALRIEEREAPEFDEEAVRMQKKKGASEEIACPSTMTRRIPVPKPEAPGARPTAQLANWPIQLRLAHPNAPYFKNARLLIAADCCAYAYASMHSDFVKGRATLIGCPKLDDVPATIAKLAEIIERNEIKDITLLHMEVPCCSGLNRLVKEAVERSKRKVPLETVVISINGEILRRSGETCA
ncbi:MAG: 4Fe-4S ferredoxin [Methanomassiliicoccales archaeon]|nr:4Fe-4S ferredoxin [Methanomassiliicoccales archaeon]